MRTTTPDLFPDLPAGPVDERRLALARDAEAQARRRWIEALEHTQRLYEAYRFGGGPRDGLRWAEKGRECLRLRDALRAAARARRAAR